MPNLTVRRAPWRSPLAPLIDRDRDRDLFGQGMRRMLDNFFEAPFASEYVGHVPAVELAETETEFTCVAELPGLKQEDVQVTFDDGALTIRGEKKDEREKEGKRYHVWERSYGTFERSFSFPTDVDAEKVRAEFRDGVLTVHLPKTATNKRVARKIDINK